MPNVHPKSGGPYTLYCDECGCWIPNTANTEMRKEGAIAYSHFCDNGVCDMRNGEILDSSRKKAQEDSAVRKHIGKPVPACCIRANIKPGMEVDIVLKKDQPTGIYPHKQPYAPAWHKSYADGRKCRTSPGVPRKSVIHYNAGVWREPRHRLLLCLSLLVFSCHGRTRFGSLKLTNIMINGIIFRATVMACALDKRVIF